MGIFKITRPKNSGMEDRIDRVAGTKVEFVGINEITEIGNVQSVSYEVIRDAADKPVETIVKLRMLGLRVIEE